ncbi:hypothetical protein EDD85DRAFT_941532 [Armillaria nabsnona]|nr:hypothetical protein EDD85DRAFT_941532 [Armillaria nabsnona]
MICNYDGHKVTNTNLSPSNITSPREMEDWKVPVSEIRPWTYTLIEDFGFETVVAFRNRAIKSPLEERGALLLACEGEILRSGYGLEEQNYVVPSHAPPVHPFDSHRRVFSFLNDGPYTPGKAPDDTPTLDSREYDRWFLFTLLGKPHYDDRKASEGQKILWRLVQHDPYTERDDWENFLRSKRDERTQNHRASRDEPTNHIYNNMPSDTLARSDHAQDFFSSVGIGSSLQEQPFLSAVAAAGLLFQSSMAAVYSVAEEIAPTIKENSVLAQYLQWKYDEFLLGRPICGLDDDLEGINGPGNTKELSSIQA